MKSKILFSVVAAMVISANANAGVGQGITRCIEETANQDLGETALAAVLSTTFAPTGTTAAIICVGVNSAEINTFIIKKEATQLKEEGTIFVPSYLGKYAADNQLSLNEAADKVLNAESSK